MMLYVFHVDFGRMMSFDMTFALSSVENLKDTIERLHGIPAANIVLLVSGGEMLIPATQVSYYAAGTDTNPIYMFLTGEVSVPPAIPQPETDTDLREQVERSLDLPICLDTVEKRARLALHMYDLAREEDHLCERLVHEQHLQQQGWYAVVANMEDLTKEFRYRFRDFCAAFDHHFQKRSKYIELLKSFGEDLRKLSRIPILPGLMSLAEADFHGFDNMMIDNDDVFSNNQQESVLLVNPSSKTNQSNQNKAELTTNCTTTSPTSSTSPNKKAKISNDSTDKNLPSLSEPPAMNYPSGRCSGSHSTTSTSSSKRLNTLNLLQWITSKENHDTLQVMSNECIQGLSTFNEDIYEKLKQDVQHIINSAEQIDVKEIKGLGDRLSKLEEFKHKIKSMVKDQRELSAAFQHNQNRAMNLGDTSILPDLCASHRSHLVVMLTNHQKIREDRRLIAKSKDELGNNLHTRLQHIVLIENRMSELDNRLLFYHRCLKRAERHITIIEQIHQTPCMYVAAVTEVVRRRIFSGEFRQWASKLSEDFTSIHSEEINRRQQFNASFEGHFLNILFPGLSDMPPTFANDTSLVFDTRLPNLTKSDIDILTSQLPDLVNKINLPDMEPVINFFISRSGDSQNEKRIEELLKQQVANVLNISSGGDADADGDGDGDGGESEVIGVNSSVGGAGDNNYSDKILQHQRLNDLQKEALGGTSATGNIVKKVGCEESETDTETEFEQLPAAATQTTVATSTTENIEQTSETFNRSTITEPLLTQSAGTLTDENESSAAIEVKRLRALLSSMSKVSMDCLRMAQNTMTTLRSDTKQHTQNIQNHLTMLDSRWITIQNDFQQKEKNLLQSNEEQTKEIERLQDDLKQKDESLSQLEKQLADMDSLHIKCATMETQIEELTDKLKSAQKDQEMAVAATRKELIDKHKTEIESLRCRYKLMTSTDSSLERLERPSSTTSELFNPNNFIAISQHEAILALQKATMEAEKEKAVQQAIEQERSILQTVISNANIFKDLLEEKEKQLDLLRDRERILATENSQLKTQLDALIHDEGSSWLKEKIEFLNKELNMEKTRRKEMETSFAALRNSTYEPNTLSRSKSNSSSQRFIVLDSCAKGDIVFVVWSIRHGQFMVVQDSQILHFVHADSLTGLNLRLPIQPETVVTDEVAIPLPYYAIGRVLEKEYCLAKKDENRYRVTKGSKFYRIKLEPLSSRLLPRRERLESCSSSTSRTISQSESQGGEQSALPTSGTVRLMAVATTPSPLTTKPSALSTNTTINIIKDSVDSAGTINSSGNLPSSSISSSSANVIPSITTTTTTTSGGNQIALIQFKERTMSITSVNEEDDEPLSIRSEHYRYTSVSEEDEFISTTNVLSTATTTTSDGIVSSCDIDDVNSSTAINENNLKQQTISTTSISPSFSSIATTTAAAASSGATSSISPITTTTTTTESSLAMSSSNSSLGKATPLAATATATTTETVITEQPTATATKELKLQLLLASADIVTHSSSSQIQQVQQETENISSTNEETQRTLSSSSSLPEFSDILPEADTLSSSQDVTSTTTATDVTLPSKSSNLANMENIVDNLSSSTIITNKTIDNNVNNDNDDQNVNVNENANQIDDDNQDENKEKIDSDTSTLTSTQSPILMSISTPAILNAASNLNLDTTNLSPGPSTNISSSFCSTSIPISIGTSEDSDEYRSLEGKDDAEEYPFFE